MAILGVAAASAAMTGHASATVYIYTPTSSTTDLWAAGTDWSATPVSAAATELTFVSPNTTVLAPGLININTDNISGAFALNILDLQGTGPASGSADSITIASTSPATSLAFAANTSNPVINLAALAGTGGLSYTVSTPITSSAALTANGSGTASFQFTGGVSDTSSFVKSGTSSLTLGGTNSVGNLYIGQDASGNGNASGTLTIASGGTLSVGTGSTSAVVVGGMTVSSSNPVSGVLDLSNASTFTANVGNFSVAYDTTGTPAGFAGTLKLGALSNITASSSVRIGESDLNLPSVGAAMTIAANGIANFKIGTSYVQQYNKGLANVTLGAGAQFNVAGLTTGARPLMQLGNSTIGTVSSTTGTFDASANGASVNLYLSYLLIGSDNQADGTTAGSVTSTLLLSSSNSNHLDLSNTTTTTLGVLTVGRANQGTGTATATMTIGGLDSTSSIVATDNGPTILVGAANASTKAIGTLNLNGTGVLTLTTTGKAITGSLLGGTGTSTVNFNGLTIKAGASTATAGQWITGLTNANIGINGASFDTGAFSVSSNQVFQNGTGGSADGGITKLGVGTLTLMGASTYNGATTVNAGTLALSGSLTSTINVNNAATLNLTGTTSGGINANTGSILIGTGSAGGALTFTGTDGVTFNPAVTGNISAASINASSATVTVQPTTTSVGNGYVILSAAGGITGAIGTNFVPATRGVLYFDNPAAPTELLFNSSSPANLVWQGANGTNPSYWDLHTTANFNNSGTTDVFFNQDAVTFDDTASSFLVNAQGTVTPSSVTFNNSAHNYTVGGGSIAGSTGLTMNGSGTVVITSSNSYTGGTTINSGTIQLGDGTVTTASLGTGAITDNGTLTANFGAGSVTLANVISGSGALNQIGASTLHITSANPSFTGTTTISNGAIQLDTAGTLGTGPIVDNVALIGNASVTLPNNISGTGTLTATGTSTLTLTGSNTYSGNTNVASGATLSIGSGGTTGSINAGAILNSGTVDLNRSDTNTMAVTLNGTGALVVNGTGTYTLSGVNTAGSLTVGSTSVGSTLIVPATASLTVGTNSSTGSIVVGISNSTTAAANGTLDLSAMTSFTADVASVFVANTNVASGSTPAIGLFKLPANASITTGTTFDIGTTAAAFGGTGTVTTANGPGTVAIQTPLFQDAYAKTHGIFTVGTGNTVSIAGIGTGARTTMYIGYNVVGGSGAWSGLFDGSAGTVSATLNGLFISYRSGGTGTNTMDGQFILSGNANHLDISGPTTTFGGLVTLGTLNPTDTAGASTGTMTIGGLDSTSSVVTTDSGPAFLLGVDGANATTIGTGVLNLNGGEIKITSTGAAIAGGSGFSTLNLNGGTIGAGASNTNFIKGLTAVNVRNNGATFDTGAFNISIGQVLSHSATGTAGIVTVTNGGSGYTTAPTVTLSGGSNGSTGTATAIITGGVVTGVTLNNVQNYSTAPTLTFGTSNGGSGATATVAYTADNAIDGGLTKIGTGTLTLSGSNTYNGGTNINAGTVVATNNKALGTGAANLATATTLSLGLNGSSTSAVVLSNPVNVSNSSTAALLLAPTANFSSGTVGAVTVGNSAQLNLQSPTGVSKGVLVAPSVSGAGTLNVGVNGLDLTNQSVASVTAMVQSGYNGGLWNGTGIVSSAAAGDTSHLTALGIVQAGTLFSSSGFDGAAPGATDTLVKYTYYGDANLSGTVDGSDYTLIDAGFNSGGTLTGWQNGDFNYDGKVDGSDYTLIDNAFNTQGVSLAAQFAPAAEVSSQFAGSSAVPEPSSIGLVVFASAGLLARRRRSIQR